MCSTSFHKCLLNMSRGIWVFWTVDCFWGEKKIVENNSHIKLIYTCSRATLPQLCLYSQAQYVVRSEDKSNFFRELNH